MTFLVFHRRYTLMSSHLAHYLPFLLLIFFVCPTITVFLMSFTSTIHYVVLLISNKYLPLKKFFLNILYIGYITIYTMNNIIQWNCCGMCVNLNDLQCDCCDLNDCCQKVRRQMQAVQQSFFFLLFFGLILLFLLFL